MIQGYLLYLSPSPCLALLHNRQYGFEINDFREFLAIGDKYKEISSLKRFVIAPAVEQINTNTDFNIDISFRKCKREIRWIQLRFNQKQEAKAKCKARTIQNQAAKQNRLIEEQKQANQASEQQTAIDWENVPVGTIYHDKTGKQWQKEVSGFLHCSEGNASIPPDQIGKALASGALIRKDVPTPQNAKSGLSDEAKSHIRAEIAKKMVDNPATFSPDMAARLY
ncbi:replication initiation protein [Snodgrassella gandavensis]|uniref:replication initiation protein n=1 Tax=Snodgrassella gandavensis TaxID=2946698 RepID=UPI001EF5352C|nr:replication initiation protein [Snodgrassella gandavensis]